jgi:hypothetical protein
MPIGNVYAQQSPPPQQQPQTLGAGAFGYHPMDEGMVAPGSQSGIAGLQTNMPGNQSGTDVIVHGTPVNMQQGIAGLQQQSAPMQQMQQMLSGQQASDGFNQQQMQQQMYRQQPGFLGGHPEF